MNVSVRMGVIYNVKHRYAIHLKFGDKFSKVVLKAEANICFNLH